LNIVSDRRVEQRRPSAKDATALADNLTNEDASRGAGEEAGVVDAATGLTETEAARRLVLYEENARAERRVGALERLPGFFWGRSPG
jgi:hypothetical protein